MKLRFNGDDLYILFVRCRNVLHICDCLVVYVSVSSQQTYDFILIKTMKPQNVHWIIYSTLFTLFPKSVNTNDIKYETTCSRQSCAITTPILKYNMYTFKMRLPFETSSALNNFLLISRHHKRECSRLAEWHRQFLFSRASYKLHLWQHLWLSKDDGDKMDWKEE